MNMYLGIVIMLAISAAFVAVGLIGNAVMGPKRYNRARLDAYECGINPGPQAPGGGRFPIKYYLTAMTFIIFDIEIVFLYPWAVSFDLLPVFAVGAMVLFLLLICVPYLYELRRGGLEWD